MALHAYGKSLGLYVGEPIWSLESHYVHDRSKVPPVSLKFTGDQYRLWQALLAHARRLFGPCSVSNFVRAIITFSVRAVCTADALPIGFCLNSDRRRLALPVCPAAEAELPDDLDAWNRTLFPLMHRPEEFGDTHSHKTSVSLYANEKAILDWLRDQYGHRHEHILLSMLIAWFAHYQGRVSGDPRFRARFDNWLFVRLMDYRRDPVVLTRCKPFPGGSLVPIDLAHRAPASGIVSAIS